MWRFRWLACDQQCIITTGFASQSKLTLRSRTKSFTFTSAIKLASSLIQICFDELRHRRVLCGGWDRLALDWRLVATATPGSDNCGERKTAAVVL